MQEERNITDCDGEVCQSRGLLPSNVCLMLTIH